MTFLSATIPNVKKAAARMIELEQQMADYEAQMVVAKTERDNLKLVELPRMMSELEIDQIGIGNLIVSIVTMVEASLPKDDERRGRALTWLFANGHSGAIKRVLELELPRDTDVVEHQVIDFLDSMSLTPTVKHGVHHATYRALCREIVKSGVAAPVEDLGIFIGRMAKVEGK